MLGAIAIFAVGTGSAQQPDPPGTPKPAPPPQSSNAAPPDEGLLEFLGSLDDEDGQLIEALAAPEDPSAESKSGRDESQVKPHE